MADQKPICVNLNPDPASRPGICKSRMQKLVKAFRAIGKILQKPYLLNLVLDDNEQWESYVRKKGYGTGRLPQLSFSDLFVNREFTIQPYLFADGGSLPTDLALLKGLAQRFPACNYLEIGTWRGESVANVSPVASRCYTMDLPDDEKRLLGMSEEYIQQHAILSRHLSNVTHLKANSRTFDFASLKVPFDLVFIDGDHHYEGVLNDTRKVFQQLVKTDTIVVWHDYAFQPEKVRFEVAAAILDGTSPAIHGKLYQVANTLCAVYLPEPVQAGKQNTLSSFEVRINLPGEQG